MTMMVTRIQAMENSIKANEGKINDLIIGQDRITETMKVIRIELKEDMNEIRETLREIQKSLGIKVGDNADHSSSQSIFGAGSGGDEQRSAMVFDEAGAITTERLSQAELRRRRDNGLCYNCDEEYKFGHRCKFSQVHIPTVIEEGSGKGVPRSCDVVQELQGAEEEEGVKMHTKCSKKFLQEIVQGAAEGETENEHASCSIKFPAQLNEALTDANYHPDCAIVITGINDCALPPPRGIVGLRKAKQESEIVGTRGVTLYVCTRSGQEKSDRLGPGRMKLGLGTHGILEGAIAKFLFIVSIFMFDPGGCNTTIDVGRIAEVCAAVVLPSCCSRFGLCIGTTLVCAAAVLLSCCGSFGHGQQQFWFVQGSLGMCIGSLALLLRHLCAATTLSLL